MKQTSETSTFSPFQARAAAIVKDALQDPALIAILVAALAPALASALREQHPDLLNPRLSDERLQLGSVTIDFGTRKVFAEDGNEIALKPREFALLGALARNAGRALSREQLLELAWPDNVAEEVNERTVDVHVRRLRIRLGDEASEQLKTVHGTGYRLERTS